MDQSGSPPKNTKEEAVSSENELPQNPTGNFSSILDNAEKKENKENTENSNEDDKKHHESGKKEEHEESEENNSPHKIERSRSRSNSNSSSKKSVEHKYKYHCCDKCKKNDKNGKTCVCVVPANQRKMHISSLGCKTCGCKGCTKEDLKEREELMRNGCCKKCMKAFSKNQKACLCQVPKAVRKQPLPPEGCNYCGCSGCNPEDTRFTKKRFNRSSSRKKSSYYKPYKKTYNRDRDDYSSKSEESERSEEQTVNIEELNMNNFDKSSIGGFITNTLNIFPPLIGFGIPQRTPNYILGKPISPP